MYTFMIRSISFIVSRSPALIRSLLRFSVQRSPWPSTLPLVMTTSPSPGAIIDSSNGSMVMFSFCMIGTVGVVRAIMKPVVGSMVAEDGTIPAKTVIAEFPTLLSSDIACACWNKEDGKQNCGCCDEELHYCV